MYFTTILLFMLWYSLQRWVIWGMENWLGLPHGSQSKGMAGTRRVGCSSFVLPPNAPINLLPSSVPFSHSISNFSLPTWLYSYSYLTKNLWGGFAARQVYVLIIGYVELHKLSRQGIKYKNSIPKQSDLPTVEITMVIKKEFCNYKNAFTMKRK